MSRKNPVRVTFQKSLDQSKCMIYTQANYICTQANYIYASELVRRALSSTTFSDHICHWLIELLMDFFVSLSHASDITAESLSMCSYCFTFM